MFSGICSEDPEMPSLKLAVTFYPRRRGGCTHKGQSGRKWALNVAWKRVDVCLCKAESLL